AQSPPPRYNVWSSDDRDPAAPGSPASTKQRRDLRTPYCMIQQKDVSVQVCLCRTRLRAPDCARSLKPGRSRLTKFSCEHSWRFCFWRTLTDQWPQEFQHCHCGRTTFLRVRDQWDFMWPGDVHDVRER